MKKIQLISALVLAVMALCSCSNTDYQKAIPANATLVVKADMKSISEKADFKNSQVMKTLDVPLAAMVKGKDLKRVKEYIDDPMKMGIDFSMPLYFFMVGDETLGLTMKVADDGDVKDFLLLLQKQGLATKPVEKDGLMCGTLVDDITYSYDGNSFLLLASIKGKSTAATGRMARELMNLKEDESFISTDAFDRLNDEEKDVVMCVQSADFMKKMNLSDLYKGFDYKGFESMASLNFEKGEAKVTSKLYAKTDEAKKLLDEMNDHMEKLNGRYLDKVADDAVIWMGAGVKGAWLLEKLKENKSLNALLFALERAVDVEQMLKAVDGDVSVELFRNEADRNKVEYVLYAELDNSKFLADVDDWKLSHKDYCINMVDKGDNQYQLTSDGQTYNWGVQGDDLYWATVWASGHAEQSTGALLKPYKKQIENSRIFIFLNWEEMVEKDNQMSDVAMVLRMWGGRFDIKSIYMTAPSVDEITWTVEMKNKEENFLKQIL